MRSLVDVKQAVIRAIEARRDAITAIGEQIWRQPEAGFREVKTAALAAEHLRRLGLDVREKLAVTGFRADLAGVRPGPTVALLGEMDALILPSHPAADPATGAVHACGHHTHVTAMLGAAMGLVDAGAAAELSGRIALVGTPAEESVDLPYRLSLLQQGLIQSLNGKPQLIREGVFDDVDMALMNHIGGYLVTDFSGHVKKLVTFLGRSSHAASPQRGVNALNAANLALHAIALMRETFANDDRIRVHGIITHGGDATSIVPDHVVLDYMIRADTADKIQSLSGRFDQAMTHCALALGADAEVRTFAGSMPLDNDDDLCELFRQTVILLDPVARPAIKPMFNQGCTDMGDLSQIMPALHAGVPGCSGTCHGANFQITDPELAYVTNAKILALMAVELLYGEAAAGKAIAAKKAGKTSLAEYVSQLDALTVSCATRHEENPPAP
ncbi:MAG: amidohydrolase [Lentisphaeria bacterium]|jgi:amidohydrolase|nr:amidohydrolase [Lentisphaeria bacterium]